MSPRNRAVNAVLARARATGRAVFGFSADKASCAQVGKGGAPTEWSHICVEGDESWTRLPEAGAGAEEAAA